MNFYWYCSEFFSIILYPLSFMIYLIIIQIDANFSNGDESFDRKLHLKSLRQFHYKKNNHPHQNLNIMKVYF